jgi:hypothetical protein
MRFVDQLQGIAVSRDLLLRSVSRVCVVDDEIADATRSRDDSFDAIRRLGGFDLRVSAQGVQLLGVLAEEKVLPPASLPETMDCSQLGGMKGQLAQIGWLKRRHNEEDAR